MASYNKFEQFVEDLGMGVHQLHAAGHTLRVYLTNNTPDAGADAVKGDLAGITEQNGYAPADIQNDFSQTGGTGTLVGTDVVLTGTTADPAFGPFRYVVLYNDTPTSPADPLIAWWDYGSSISINNGETFTIDFGASVATIA